MTSSQDQEVQRIAYEREQLTYQLNTLQKQHELLSSTYADYSLTKESLVGLEGQDSDNDILIPLNSSGFVYLEVNLKEKDKVLLSSGAQTRRFVSIEEAKIACEEKMKAIKQTMDDFAQSIQQVIMEIQKREEQLQEILVKR